jgi:hypothetical protein
MRSLGFIARASLMESGYSDPARVAAEQAAEMAYYETLALLEAEEQRRSGYGRKALVAGAGLGAAYLGATGLPTAVRMARANRGVGDIYKATKASVLSPGAAIRGHVGTARKWWNKDSYLKSMKKQGKEGMKARAAASRKAFKASAAGSNPKEHANINKLRGGGDDVTESYRDYVANLMERREEGYGRKALRYGAYGAGASALTMGIGSAVSPAFRKGLVAGFNKGLKQGKALFSKTPGRVKKQSQSALNTAIRGQSIESDRY